MSGDKTDVSSKMNNQEIAKFSNKLKPASFVTDTIDELEYESVKIEALFRKYKFPKAAENYLISIYRSPLFVCKDSPAFEKFF